MRIRSSPGFSIIEVVMVIGIIAIVFGLGLSFSLSIYQSQMLNAERDNLAVILGRARSEALSNLNESDHGVYIGSDNYVIFQGDTYASRNAAGDEIFPERAASLFPVSPRLISVRWMPAWRVPEPLL